MKLWTYSRRGPTSFGAMAAVAAMALLGSACGGAANNNSAPQGTFVFGAALPLSGVYSQYGDVVKGGLEVGVDRANAGGGIAGKKVKLVLKDTASDPNQSLAAVQELHEVEHADFVMPGYLSVEAKAALPYTTAQKMFTITGSSTPALGDPTTFPYQFIASDPTTQRAPAVAAAAKQVASREGATKVGILVATNPAQVADGDTLNKLLPTIGLQVVGYEKVAADATDMTPQLAKLRQAGAGLVVFEDLSLSAIHTVMTDIQTLGWKAPLVATPAMVVGDLKLQVPAAVQGQFFAANYRTSTAIGGVPSDTAKKYTDELSKKVTITSAALSAFVTDSVFFVKWTYDGVHAASGKFDGPTLAKQLEKIGSANISASTVGFKNPGYSATDHTPKGADYTDFWAIVGAVTPKNGLYSGAALTAVKS